MNKTKQTTLSKVPAVKTGLRTIARSSRPRASKTSPVSGDTEGRSQGSRVGGVGGCARVQEVQLKQLLAVVGQQGSGCSTSMSTFYQPV